MRYSWRFSLPVHSSIELVIGISMMIAPILLGFGPAGLLTSILLGAILTGAAVSFNGQPLGAALAFHLEFDSALAAATAFASLTLAIAGQRGPALLLAAAAMTQACLRVATRYVTPG
jgi:hypothetical protein